MPIILLNGAELRDTARKFDYRPAADSGLTSVCTLGFL